MRVIRRAHFELSVDGVPRSYRDRKDRWQNAQILKSRNPNSVVKLKDLHTMRADGPRLGQAMCCREIRSRASPMTARVPRPGHDTAPPSSVMNSRRIIQSAGSLFQPGTPSRARTPARV